MLHIEPGDLVRTLAEDIVLPLPSISDRLLSALAAPEPPPYHRRLLPSFTTLRNALARPVEDGRTGSLAPLLCPTVLPAYHGWQEAARAG